LTKCYSCITIIDKEVFSVKNILKMLRAKHNMSQEKLAELIGISRPALSEIENGKVIPGGKTVIRIANIFGLPAEQIFFEKEEFKAKEVAK
jgi:putative transcriptional regulator